MGSVSLQGTVRSATRHGFLQGPSPGISTFHHDTSHDQMGNVQVRLPDDLEDALEALAGEMHTSRSEVMRNALAEGLASMRLERALSRYVSGQLSLEAAARYAGVSLSRLASVAADRGIPFYRYTVEEADADAEAAADLLDGREDA